MTDHRLTEEWMDAYRARSRADAIARKKRDRRNVLTGRTFMWHFRKRFPNIAAMQAERNELYRELLEDRSAPVRDVIRELGEDIARAKERSWPLRFRRLIGLPAA